MVCFFPVTRPTKPDPAILFCASTILPHDFGEKYITNYEKVPNLDQNIKKVFATPNSISPCTKNDWVTNSLLPYRATPNTVSHHNNIFQEYNSLECKDYKNTRNCTAGYTELLNGHIKLKLHVQIIIPREKLKQPYLLKLKHSCSHQLCTKQKEKEK